MIPVRSELLDVSCLPPPHQPKERTGLVTYMVYFVVVEKLAWQLDCSGNRNSLAPLSPTLASTERISRSIDLGG